METKMFDGAIVENGLIWNPYTSSQELKDLVAEEDWYGASVPIIIGVEDIVDSIHTIRPVKLLNSFAELSSLGTANRKFIYWMVSPLNVDYIKEKSDWRNYFLKITNLVAERSSCLRRQVGAIAVKEKRIIATGYNGAPSKVDHCDKTGCLREMLQIKSGERHELCRAVHAEQNLICQAAQFEVSLQDSTIFCTHMPCFICFKMLINCKVKRIYFFEGYPDKMTLQMYAQNVTKLPKLTWLVDQADSFSALEK